MTDHERVTSTRSIFIFIFGFLGGVFASSFIYIQPLTSLLVVVVGAAILIAEKVHKGEVGREALFLALALVSLGFGSFRYGVKDFHTTLAPSSTGVVVSEAELRENTTRFVMRADNGERVLVNSDLYSEVKYGDKVAVDGRWGEPGIIDDGIGRPFDYAAYLAKDDIYHTLGFAEVEILSRGHGNPLKHFLFGIKNSVVQKMREILPEPESSLLAGLVVAGKGAMPENILDEFRRAGIIHIVVLSGYNVAIIAEFIRKFFENLLARVHPVMRRLGSRAPAVAAGMSVFGILAFVLMTGAEATVVRASIMVLAVIAAKVVGKNYSAPRALLVAAFLMVIHNPKILVFDPSFQLSFLATCGLVWLSPIFEKFLARVPDFWGFRSMLATTVATQAAVLPFLIWSMGDVSLVSLPANILVLLFIPAAMGFGFAAALLAVISPVIALPISFIAHLILAWILGVSSVFGNLSFASVAVPQFPFWVVVAIYIMIALLVRKSYKKSTI